MATVLGSSSSISPSPYFYQFRLLFIFTNSSFSSKFYSYFSFLFIFCSFSFLSLPSLRISEKFLFYEVKYQFMVPTRYSSNIFLHSINVETRNVRLRYLVPRDQFHFLLIFINFAFSFYQFLFYSKFINSSTSLFLSISPLPYSYQFLFLPKFINSSSSTFLLRETNINIFRNFTLLASIIVSEELERLSRGK